MVIVHMVLVCIKGAVSARLLSRWLLEYLLQVQVLLLGYECTYPAPVHTLCMLAQLLSSDLIDRF